MRQFKGFQRGVNLGGWYSQCDHSEQRYDTFIRDEDFAVIRSWGADHVRVPVDYELLENDDGSPRESGYARLEHTITLCRANGLNMVLDLHKTAGFSFDPGEQEAGFFENETYQERFFRLWERIAEHFRSDSDMLAFELLNEVTEQAYCDTWNRIASECIRRIRTLAPTVNILVGGYWHNSAVSVKDIDVLLSELFGTERINTDERFEHKLNTIFLSQIKIGRLACCRLRLGDENLLNFQGCTV